MEPRERVAMRNTRILAAFAVALISMGIVLAAWGFVVLSELPRLETSADASDQTSDPGAVPEIPSQAPGQRIARVKAVGVVTLASGAVALIGGVLGVNLSLSARRDSPPD